MMPTIALIIFIFASSGSSQSIYYVRPISSSQDCPGEPCLDLHQYMIEQATKYFTNGSTFIFLPGNHTLQTAAKLSSVSDVTLSGESNATVLLGNEILCEKVTNLVIFGLKFLLSFDNSISNMSALIIEQSFDVIINSNIFQGNPDHIAPGRALKLIDSTAVLSNNIFTGNSVNGSGGAIFSEESFITMNDNLFEGNEAVIRGGAIFASESSIDICGTRTKFVENSAGSGGAIFSSHSHILADVGEVTFLSNSAKKSGGALAIQFQEHEYSNISISANFVKNTAGICGGAGVIGTGIIFKDTFAEENSDTAFCITGDVNFIGTTHFSRNTGLQGGAMYIHPDSQVSFNDCTVFNDNSAESGGAIYAMNAIEITFTDNLSLLKNMAQVDGGAIYAHLGAEITFHQSATVEVLQNSAQKGGAMYLKGGTSMMFDEGVELTTAHNYASQYGGVIYCEDDPTTAQCEYNSKEVSEIRQLSFCLIKFHSGWPYFSYSVKSYNDSSEIDGSFIYGGLLDRCWIDDHDYWLFETEYIIPFHKMLTEFQVESFDGVRSITSKPYQLCFCNKHSSTECTGTVMNIETYRGKTFAVLLLALDQVRESTSAQIIAKMHGISGLKSKQSYQTLSPNCSELKYTLYSASGDSEELILYPDGPCHDTGVAKVIVNVTLLPCPHGFNNTRGQCICEKRLQLYGADCNIENVSITRGPDSRFWMNIWYNNNTYQGLILFHTCPVEYCTIGAIRIDLDNPDMQCANNRSGMLCGTCAANYSLMLGSSRCKECYNTYLALLLPFAAAGIALVFLLSFLRLTVAIGMINSVILYVNIVQAKRGIFFPSNTVNVLTVFIAWMNLDLGFETCFYNGLTAYAETWLQFAFPIYVWMLISIIILTSKYSLTVSKWIGHNPIAVLATLLLMSYTKILKIIIDVYRFANLDYPEDKKVTRWLKDANVDYLHSKHLALSVVTSLVLVFIFLPYTLLLLLGYILYRFSDKKIFHWLNRLKPLLDAYYAPYNKHTRYWPGFLLLVRCALYGTFSFGETWSLLAICVTFTLILAYKCLPWKVHCMSYNDILEIVTYTNLTILAAATSAGVSSAALVYSLVGIVFSIMIGIIFYQFYSLHIAESVVIPKLRALTSRCLQDASVEEKGPAIQVSSTRIELRELLLEN